MLVSSKDSSTAGSKQLQVGWQTTYSSANRPVIEHSDKKAAVAAAATRARPASAVEAAFAGAAAASATARTSGAPQRAASASARFQGGSSYVRDFCGDPIGRMARPVPREVTTLHATTREMNEGTTRACHHVPGTVLMD